MSGPLGSQQWMYASGGFYDHTIDGSLRFNDDDSSYLEKTFSTSGNAKTFTISFWFKRGNIDNAQYFFAGGTTVNDRFHMDINASGTWQIEAKNSGTTVIKMEGGPVLRDPNSWYHFVLRVDTTQATASDRVRLYKNGELVTFNSNTYPAQNTNLHWNVNDQIRIGRAGWATSYFDGYMAEFINVDGQSLAPTEFGETKSGIWIPKAYSGSYGTNGFHLEFAGNANDTSGNGNNFTANNISAYDYVPDSPTNNFANLMIHNHPAANSNAFSQGNLRFTPGTGDSARNTNRMAISNMLVSSGKWYAEAYIVDNGSAHFVGVGPKQTVSPTANNTRYAYVYSADGNSYVRTGASESISTYASSYTVGDVIGIYVDMDAATPVVYFSKNGQWSNGSGSWNQSSPSGGITLGDTFFTESADFPGTFTFHAVRASGAVSPTTIWNFGQDDTFTGNITAGGNADANGYGSFKYAPPTDALALCTANLPAPAIDPAADATPEDYFDTVLYTAATSNGTYTHGDLTFRPDFTWIKNRNNVEEHYLIDVVRGNTSATNTFLRSNNTAAEGAGGVSGTTFSVTDTGYEFVETSINSGELYFNGRTYAGWNWKAGGTAVSNTDGSITSSVSASPTSGFSIVTYSGNGTAGATVGHGLGATPKMIIFKVRNTTDNWTTYHAGIASDAETDGIFLNLTNPAQDNVVFFNDTAPTSSVFSLGTNHSVNYSGNTYVAYCFADVDGFSKAGSYVGNGSTDGPVIVTGFRPAWVIVKRTDSTGSWNIADAARSPYNEVDEQLQANLTNAESTVFDMDFLSNGIKVRTTDSARNASGGTYIYMAFAEQPFKYANAR